MTPEEAGQRILEGNPYIDCPLTDEYTRGHLNNSCVVSGCRLCKGTTVILDLDYFLACSLLGLPVPNQRVIGWQASEEIALPPSFPDPSMALKDALAEVVSKMTFVGTPGPGGNWVKDK